MAPILTIFGPKKSRRRDLFFEKNLKGKSEQKYFKKFSEKFSKISKKYLIIFLIQGGFSNRSPSLFFTLGGGVPPQGRTKQKNKAKANA